MKKIKIGQIGTLHDHAFGMTETVRRYPEIFDFVGYVPEKCTESDGITNAYVYDGAPVMTEEELFNSGVDAVLVESFELDNIKIAQRCIDRGIHVHIDKPAGDDIAAFEKLLRDAKTKALTVQMSYMYRYNPSVKECYRRFKSGELGEIYEVDAIMNTHHDPQKRKWLNQFPGGIMFYLGCHMIDLIYMFQGTPKNIVTFNKSTGFDGVNSPDSTLAVFEYEKGASIARATSTEINGYGRRQLVVCASNATYRIEPLERRTRTFYTDNTFDEIYTDKKKELIFDDVASDGRRYDEMLLEFAACVRGEITNPYTYEYELQLQKLILASCGLDIDYKKETIM